MNPSLIVGRLPAGGDRAADPGPGGACADAGEDPPPPAARDDCPELFECASACADQACLDACIEQGDPRAQRLHGAIIECTERTGCAPRNTCGMECRAQVNACLGDFG